MIPIFQNEFGKKGNCFQACIASLFELRLDKVPNFCQDYPIEWYNEFNKWLSQYNLVSVMIDYNTTDLHARQAMKDSYLLVGGRSVTGLMHQVIYKDWKMCHDPHPRSGGIIGQPIDITLLVVKDPMKGSYEIQS